MARLPFTLTVSYYGLNVGNYRVEPAVLRDFFTELRRRKIWWVTGIYLAVAWLAVQVVAALESALSLPWWMDTATVVFLMVGLPVAILLAWAQETQAESEAQMPQQASEPEVPANSREADPPSIAVLPFENMSDDKEQEYLADGMTEELINILAQFRGWRITARNSSFAYKGKNPDIRDVGRDLGVRYVVEGSIRRVGDNIRVTGQLIATSDGTHIWSNTYDRPLDEIFALQDEVVLAISRALTGNIMSEELRHAARTAPENLDAWALLVRARSIHLSDRASRDEEMSLVREALKIDPDYPAANGAMAWILARNINYGFIRNTEDKIAEARQYAERALTLAERDAFQLAQVAFAYSFLGDTGRAMVLAEKAHQITGNMTHGYATILGNAGRLDEGISGFREISDQDFNQGAYSSARGLALLLAIKGEYEEALELTLDVHHAHPSEWLVIGDLANLYGHLGEYEKAREAWAQVCEMVPSSSVTAWQAGWRQQYGTDEAVEGLTGGYRKAGITD